MSDALHVAHVVDAQTAEAVRPTRMVARPFSRYMMATEARHRERDISAGAPALCLVYNENGENWIGQWVHRMDAPDTRFPKATTRELTEEERLRYRKRRVGSTPPSGLLRPSLPVVDDEAEAQSRALHALRQQPRVLAPLYCGHCLEDSPVLRASVFTCERCRDEGHNPDDFREACIPCKANDSAR